MEPLVPMTMHPCSLIVFLNGCQQGGSVSVHRSICMSDGFDIFGTCYDGILQQSIEYATE